MPHGFGADVGVGVGVNECDRGFDFVAVCVWEADLIWVWVMR